MNVLVRTSALQDAGLIGEEKQRALNLIYHYNPLLFDFVLKRTIRHPETGEQLPASMFMIPPELETR